MTLFLLRPTWFHKKFVPDLNVALVWPEFDSLHSYSHHAVTVDPYPSISLSHYDCGHHSNRSKYEVEEYCITLSLTFYLLVNILGNYRFTGN